MAKTKQGKKIVPVKSHKRKRPGSKGFRNKSRELTPRCGR